MKTVQTLGVCGDMVRIHDPDRFLLSLLMPPALRPPLWALFAFNFEVAKTREVVTDTTIGLIRLTWWREKIADIYASRDIQGHDVLSALADTIRAYHLPQELFDQIIYAREFDLEDIPPENLGGLINYADFTTTPLTALACAITGDVVDTKIMRDVSIAYALSGLLSAIPFHAQHHRCYMPQDFLLKQGISPQQVYDGKARLQPVVKTIREAGIAMIPNVPKQAHFLRGMRAIARINLAHIKAAQDTPFSARFNAPITFKALRVLLTR